MGTNATHNGRRGQFGRWLARNHKRVLIIGGLALSVEAAIFFGLPAQSDDAYVPLSELLEHATTHNVDTVTIDRANDTITATTDDGGELVAQYDPWWAEDIATSLDNAGVSYDFIDTSDTSGLQAFADDYLIPSLPVIVLVALALFLMRGMMPRRGKFEAAQVPTTRFEDVAGVDEAVDEMRELVTFLSEGERFTAMGARPPRGALFVGPPGTGKTLLARAVAGEAGVPFFQVAGSDFVEMYAGLGAANVRTLFKKAKSAGRAIIFIDEIDSVGMRRSSNPTQGASAETENTLTALLTEIDGFESTDVIVIAATNRLDVIDPALRRRLEHVVEVPLPDRGGRTKIMRLHAQGKPFADDIDWDAMGRQAFGMSGAEIERVVNEACMDAVRTESASVTTEHLMSALSTIQVGRARTSATVSDRDKEIAAWHEAGHAVVCALAKHLSDPTYVTIVPRGGSGGHTRPGGTDDAFRTRDHMLDELMMAMGGRAAEKLLLGPASYTQGAEGDLQQATALATAMVAQYGMGTHLTQVPADTIRMGGQTVRDLQREVDTLLDTALERADALLKRHRDDVATLASALIEHETLSGAHLREVMSLDARSAASPTTDIVR